MFIQACVVQGKQYIRLAEAVRVKNKQGKKQSRTKIILNLGCIEKYDDGKPNYLERLKKSFKEGNPLIEELKDYVDKQKKEYRFIEMKENMNNRIGHSRIISNIVLEKLIEEIGIDRLFATMKKERKIKYDVYGFFKMLVMGRIMEPASKIETVRQNEEYYEPILKGKYNEDNVYDTLTFIGENKDKIVRRINTKLKEKYGAKKDYIYYDVTNFYFEREEDEEDEYDEEGNLKKKGFRKVGVSKENRRLPLVQMGLFMDNEGMPISIESFAGNTVDQKTLRPALSKNIEGLEFSRFVLVADRGICNEENIAHIVEAGNGYIISKSLLKKTKKQERQWAYSQEGYIKSGEDFKYKSRIINREITDEKGNKREIKEKVVVYWSRKFYERSIRENINFLNFIKKIQDKNNNFKISSTQVKALKRFMKEEYVNINTGEVINSKDIRMELDYEKVEEYKQGLGYYQIVTSEIGMSEEEIIEKYHGLTRLEEQFRIMKGTLETRPIYVWTQEHINAHLMICLIALIIIRMIQRQINKYTITTNTNGLTWHNELSADRIQKALNKFRVDVFQNDLYRLMDTDYADLNLIIKAFGMKIPNKMFIRRGDIKEMKSSIEKVK